MISWLNHMNELSRRRYTIKHTDYQDTRNVENGWALHLGTPPTIKPDKNCRNCDEGVKNNMFEKL